MWNFSQLNTEYNYEIINIAMAFSLIFFKNIVNSILEDLFYVLYC